MDEDKAREEIRRVIATWLRASAEGDQETVLSLMAEDVVFLRPGQPPMRGRKAYAAASQGNASMKIEGKSDVREIEFMGECAYCWNHLAITLTPLDGGPAMRHEGDVLSLFRREPDGRWVIFRDANLLAAPPEKRA